MTASRGSTDRDIVRRLGLDTDLRELRPDVPAPVAEITARMLAKQPENRFADPADPESFRRATDDRTHIPTVD